MLSIRDTVCSNGFPAVNWILIGLNALVLMNLFPPSGMGRPTVEYIRVPYPTRRLAPRNGDANR